MSYVSHGVEEDTSTREGDSSASLYGLVWTCRAGGGVFGSVFVTLINGDEGDRTGESGIGGVIGPTFCGIGCFLFVARFSSGEESSDNDDGSQEAMVFGVFIAESRTGCKSAIRICGGVATEEKLDVFGQRFNTTPPAPSIYVVSAALKNGISVLPAKNFS